MMFRGEGGCSDCPRGGYQNWAGIWYAGYIVIESLLPSATVEREEVDIGPLGG
jgi:hypothetical protein